MVQSETLFCQNYQTNSIKKTGHHVYHKFTKLLNYLIFQQLYKIIKQSNIPTSLLYTIIL